MPLVSMLTQVMMISTVIVRQIINIEIPLFTAEEETKFTHRYEEGYDLSGAHYKTWLEIKHPRITDDVKIMINHQLLSGI